MFYRTLFMIRSMIHCDPDKMKEISGSFHEKNERSTDD